MYDHDPRNAVEQEAAYQRAESVLERIESRIASGTSRARLANEADIQGGILDSLLRREFSLDGRHNSSAEALESLETWINDADAKPAPKTAAPALTPTYQRTYSLLAQAKDLSQLIAITGDVGIGKSRAGKAFAAANPKTDQKTGAVYVEFSEVDAKPTAALNRIFEALRGNGYLVAHNQCSLLDVIAALLKPGDLLILDECNYLSGRNGRDGRALDIVRDLHGKCGAGIAMLGNPELRARVWGKSQDFAALASRVTHFPMNHTSPEDVDVWLQWAEITGKNARDAAVRIAARPGQNGGLRTLDRVIEQARIFYPGKITADALLKTAHTIGRL